MGGQNNGPVAHRVISKVQRSRLGVHETVRAALQSEQEEKESLCTHLQDVLEQEVMLGNSALGPLIPVSN